ncbi:hypothetical protein EG348_09865 [Chryseobacterium sp. G0201]|nr:hypothetical protein EG348_09865 [Chryseobacterium sp. G0201]
MFLGLGRLIDYVGRKILLQEIVITAPNTLAQIGAVTPQQEVGSERRRWREEYEWRAGNSF